MSLDRDMAHFTKNYLNSFSEIKAKNKERGKLNIMNNKFYIGYRNKIDNGCASTCKLIVT